MEFYWLIMCSIYLELLEFNFMKMATLSLTCDIKIDQQNLIFKIYLNNSIYTEFIFEMLAINDDVVLKNAQFLKDCLSYLCNFFKNYDSIIQKLTLDTQNNNLDLRYSDLMKILLLYRDLVNVF